MANFTKEALRHELWAMLDDDIRLRMTHIKETYLDSAIADIESYANGKILEFLKEQYGCKGIESIEEKGGGLVVQFKQGKPMDFKTIPDIVSFIQEEAFANR